MSLFPKRRRSGPPPAPAAGGGFISTPPDPIKPASAFPMTPPTPLTPATPITPSAPPRPAQHNMSERPPPANLLEVRRPSHVPIPREEPVEVVAEPAPIRDVVDIPPPAPAPDGVRRISSRPKAPAWEPSREPEPVKAQIEIGPVAQAVPAEIEEAATAKRDGLVRARFRPEDLLRVPANPFVATSEDDIPEGMATEDQLDNFRELRTRLLAMAEGLGLEHFTTLVVPLHSGAGGSFVARNLAAAFALQDGRAAMLVDCNLKHPTQHEAFSTPAVGLFDFLDEPEVQYDSLLRMTGIPALHLIPAGRARSKFREYFSSAPMRALMEAIQKSEYFVFLDGPPAVGSPDARILSEFSDFVILVVSYGHAKPAEIAQAAAMFDPKKFAGVVFNQRG